MTQHHPFQDQETTVSTIMHQNSRSWDVWKILDTFPRNQVAKIIATPILPAGEQDKLIWPFSKTGSYKVKSGYHIEKVSRSEKDTNVCSSSNSVDTNFWNQL